MSVIECDDSSDGEGEPIVFIHGIGAARDAWSDLVPLLRDSFRCITYDLRGHGVSPKSSLPFGLDDLVADLEALRARLGLEQAHFIGHSLGGMIAPAYGRAYPERVLSLGLLSTAAGRTADDTAKVRAVVTAMEEQGIGKILRTLTARWFTDDFIAKHPDKVERRLQQVIETDPEVFMTVFRIYAETNIGPWLHEVAAPSLVLTGELDGGCNPRLNQFIAGQMPNAELAVLGGFKHAILREAPELVAGHIRRFIGGLRQAA